MRKFLLIFIVFASTSILNAQSPQAFKYQAVIRNSDGSIKQNESVTIQIEILQGSIEGSSVYLETHNKTTNSFGLVNLDIGTGTSSDDLTSINWSNGPYFLSVTVNGTKMGVTQLLSVPYALHSTSAETLSGSITESQISDLKDYLISESDSIFVTSEAANITSADITNLENLSGTNTGDQDLDAVLIQNNSAENKNITNLADPVNAQDAATKAYVTFSVSPIGDTLFLGSEQYVIIPGISAKNTQTFTDIDGNIYPTVLLGSQLWMAENLKTTKFNDATDIPLVSDNTTWGNLSTPGYCWYDDNESIYGNTYGALYNWHAVNTGNLCPTGWHVPTDAEWTTLTTYLGGAATAGGKLKESGTLHWLAPNLGATNETGFTALPGSFRYNNGEFYLYIRQEGYWWSSTEYDTGNSWVRYIINEGYNVNRINVGKEFGMSVRCIRNSK